MSKQYLTKLHNELTNKKIQHEYIQEDHLTCIKIQTNGAQPVVIEEYYDCDLECPVLVTQTQSCIKEFGIDSEKGFNSYVDSLVFIFG
jgi:hypothetical protein